MRPAQDELAAAIEGTMINQPICPIYQNVVAKPISSPAEIKENLIAQLTASVMWTQSVKNMYANGITHFVECGGTGKVLGSLIKKICPEAEISSI
jgi:[acyl-carrier-protein] S-malonyltransferase